MCVGGGTEIFIYIRRLGPFLMVQNLEFQYFWGGFRNIIILGALKILWIYHYKTGMVLGVISIHFRVFFLRSICRMGILFGVAQNYKYFLESG